MTALSAKTPFTSANPHALATILEASETKSIIARGDPHALSGAESPAPVRQFFARAKESA